MTSGLMVGMAGERSPVHGLPVTITTLLGQKSVLWGYSDDLGEGLQSPMGAGRCFCGMEAKD